MRRAFEAYVKFWGPFRLFSELLLLLILANDAGLQRNNGLSFRVWLEAAGALVVMVWIDRTHRRGA